MPFRPKIISVICFLITLSFSALLVSCQKSSKYLIVGDTSAALYDAANQFNFRDQMVSISSEGGEIKYGILLAKKISNENISLEVFYVCLSACAEFLLPAANKIKFIEEPMVGFHWGPILSHNEQLRAGADLSGCDTSDFDYQENLFKEKELSTNFWLEVEDRLVLKSYELGSKGCYSKKRKFENDFWFPTSQQLKNLLGLDFEGKVCADNVETCKIKVNNVTRKGIRIMIGDTLHISEGSNADCFTENKNSICGIPDFQKFIQNKHVISGSPLLSSDP